MNNTATNTATCPTVRKQIGKTTYIVRVHFSQTAKETICLLYTSHPQDKPFSHIWSNAKVSGEQGNRRLIADRPGYTLSLIHISLSDISTKLPEGRAHTGA